MRFGLLIMIAIGLSYVRQIFDLPMANRMELLAVAVASFIAIMQDCYELYGRLRKAINITVKLPRRDLSGIDLHRIEVCNDGTGMPDPGHYHYDA